MEHYWHPSVLNRCLASRRQRRELAGLLAGLIFVACAPQPTATPTRVPETATWTATPVLPIATATGAPPESVVPSPTSLPANTLTPAPLPTARPRLYEDMGSREILSAILPNMPLTEEPDGFLVFGSPDW